MTAMKKIGTRRIDTYASGQKMVEVIHSFSHRILRCVNCGVSRTDFLKQILKILIDFSGYDAVELQLKEGKKYYRCEDVRSSKQPFSFEIMPCVKDKDDKIIPCAWNDSDLGRLCRDVARAQFDSSSPFFTKRGSFWTGDTGKSLVFRSKPKRQVHTYNLYIKGGYKSLALFPLTIGDERIGLLQLKNKRRDYFVEDEIGFYESLAQTLGVALVNYLMQAALCERVKELTCLYNISQVAQRPDISLKEILQGIVEILPLAWQYSDIAFSKIILDGHSYSTPGFQECRQKQTADIVVNGVRRGVVEVGYAEEKVEIDEGPFLKEERNLIDAVTTRIALIIKRKQAEEERLNIQNQLRHADRLATIGELAAGVAHELNEPLGNILGFAQLVKKCPRLPKQVKQDIENIVTASLYAREVIKKLMFFARQTPPKKNMINVNKLVEEGLYFLESRCAKEGIKLVRSFSPDLPEITADPAQLNQVLVNLVVNAIQAMSRGGRLTIRTLACDSYISLIVEDTGIGMSDEVVKHIFTPFFTTKEVGQGTGLGLPVVHGIVTSHGGSIKVESKVGRGTRFEIQLPMTKLP